MAVHRSHHLDITGAIDVNRLLAGIREERGQTGPVPVMQRRRAPMDPCRLGALVLVAGLGFAALVATTLVILLDGWRHP